MNGSPGPDGVTPLLLKIFCEELSEPLLILFEKSFESGIFSDLWKLAYICPLKKPGKSKNKAESFRPVALTSQIGKLMESMVNEVIKEFLEKNNLLSPKQHGFRAQRSTISQLLAHYENIINGIENNCNVDVILLDFQKAFDKADFGLILHRCKSKGIYGKLGIWLENYLHNRKQAVIENDQISKTLEVESGVPQGSILGPLLFLLLIDNIGDEAENSAISIFADDTKASKKIASIEDAESLQNDLNALYTWSEHNNMAFHGLKFECLKFGNQRELADQYDYIDSTGANPIREAQNVRDLGIYIDAGGSFDYHISKAISKAKKLCGWIGRSFFNKSINLRRKLWRTYIEPVLDYGSQLYCPISITQISNLETVQRHYTYHTENLHLYNYWDRLSLMKLNSVQRRQERYRIIYIFKILQGLVPNPGIKYDTNTTRGRMVIFPKIKST